MKDPRGPIRAVLEVRAGTGPTYLVLSCGHTVERVNHFTYRVGEHTHCFTCAREESGK